jgi:phytoene dehydrogenase-like protein
MVSRELAATFDGIIIGAGHHGLILGSYLAKAGLRILLLDRRLAYGGGLMTTEPSLPGFYMNPHSINHFNITSAPWYRDLDLSDSVPYITPRYDMATPHKDGTAVVWSRERNETINSIARFSRKDAQTFARWNQVSDQLNDLVFLPERFSEPIPEAERNELLARTALGRAFLEMIEQQPLEFITTNFENEKIQLLLLFRLSLFGTVLYDAIRAKSPMGAVIRGFDLNAGYQICAGGSWNLARGLMETFIRSGGTFVNQAHVARITLTGGRATGVELADGRAYKALQFVSSTVDVPQTFNQLVGLEHLPEPYLERVKAFHHTSWALFGLHLCLREAPKYSSAGFDPNINAVQKYNIGCETMDQLMETHREVAAGKMPSRISFGAGSMTVFDPSQAPRGMHTAYGWHVMPFRPNGEDPSVIDDLKEDFADRMIDTWRQYAPNLTTDNIIARWLYTPHDYTRELINMVDGDIFMGAFTADQVMFNHIGYRTPIPGLYLSGSATHPGGAISGGGGYISARVIAEDLGIRPWWKPVDAREALQSLR